MKLGWTFEEIKHGLQTAYAQVLCNTSIHSWIRQFHVGHVSIVEKPRVPRQKTGCSAWSIRKVEDLVAQDRSITLKQISVKTGLAPTSIQRILKKDLRLTKKCSIFVPAVLTEAHKQCHQDVCNFMTRLMHQDPRVFRSVVTMDESWIWIYDPHMKAQSREWLRKDEPCPQKLQKTLATAKVMILTFFDSRGMVYIEYVQRPQTVNQQTFRAIFRRFDAAHARRCPHNLVHGRKFLHLDNAPTHNVTLTLQLIQQLGWTRLPQPSYSLDLAPNDFWLYQRLKKNLRE